MFAGLATQLMDQGLWREKRYPLIFLQLSCSVSFDVSGFPQAYMDTSPQFLLNKNWWGAALRGDQGNSGFGVSSLGQARTGRHPTVIPRVVFLKIRPENQADSQVSLSHAQDIRITGWVLSEPISGSPGGTTVAHESLDDPIPDRGRRRSCWNHCRPGLTPSIREGRFTMVCCCWQQHFSCSYMLKYDIWTYIYIDVIYI